MSRPVTERASIVIKSEQGGRIEINGKGNAADSMFTAFYCLSAERRSVLLDRMRVVHAELLAKATGAES